MILISMFSKIKNSLRSSNQLNKFSVPFSFQNQNENQFGDQSIELSDPFSFQNQSENQFGNSLNGFNADDPNFIKHFIKNIF